MYLKRGLTKANINVIVRLTHLNKVFKQKRFPQNMFGKRECNRCYVKSSKGFNFCPNCGVPFNGNDVKKNEFGILGESDVEEEKFELSNSLFGSMGEKMMGKMFESAVKMLEKEMEKEMKKNKPKTNLQLFINGRKINVGENSEVDNAGKNLKKLPNNELKGFSGLPKKEPETNVRRFSNRVVYEVDMPGVSAEKDISIIKLENSIEVKGLGKDSAYRKIIPISLPIKNYNISNGKLILELGIK